jgi:hypothetical protein
MELHEEVLTNFINLSSLAIFIFFCINLFTFAFFFFFL